MTAAISWLVGRTLAEVEQREFSWSFAFSGGGCVVTESAWRLITKDGISVTSEDHGQMFGLKSPVDAIARLLATTKEKKIQESRVVENTSDLVLRFEDGVRLEFLNLSCGYEAWRATLGTDDVICLGGGALLKNEKTG
jgi:predicted flavoprotein YhiN